MERHTYEPCDHPGRHGYTLPGDAGEYEFCERCRRGPEAHPVERNPHDADDAASRQTWGEGAHLSDEERAMLAAGADLTLPDGGCDDGRHRGHIACWASRMPVGSAD